MKQTEKKSIKKILEQISKYKCGYHMRVRRLLKDRLKALSELKGGENDVR